MRNLFNYCTDEFKVIDHYEVGTPLKDMDIPNTTVLNLNDSGIETLKGCPPYIKNLLCNNCPLVDLEGIPAKLELLSILGTRITTVNHEKLLNLICDESHVQVVIANRLNRLSCINCPIRKIKAPLLQNIWMDRCNLPLGKLPRSIKYLSCVDCELETLEGIPMVRELYCHNNQLTSLVNIPPTLKVLDCRYNRISNLRPLVNTQLKTLIVVIIK